MKTLLLILICTVFLCFSSCYEPIPGSGNVIRWEETFTTINSITLKSIGTVFVTAGSPQKIEIEIDDNFVEDVNLDVSNKKLAISTNRTIGPTVFNIYITIADISELINKGSGKISVQNNFSQGSTLWLNASGSGKIEIAGMNVSDCQAYNSGSGQIIANSGTVSIGEFYLESSGNINLSNVVISEVEATNSGSGKILFTVTDKLDATITGSGNIEYWGNPADIQQVITGSGKLIKRN